ncbi:Gfo/Idh/MocA family protein [Endozoicomonas sp.]|uniref:Gfo/Idh/MocA family protein n=1 Tax=Endozoicomonas sp. TaxID=1892382 RepID=UPI003AF69981
MTTRHDTHAGAVVAALEAGKHVYVEKPLGLTVDELATIHRAYGNAIDRQVMVGFNRRFAPLTTLVKSHFSSVKSPLVINIRTNAGAIPMDHWIQDPLVGGGRMIGEGCHFVDLASALADSFPVSVYAVGSAKAAKSALLNDNLVVTLTFANGSIASITYTADGAKAMEKEYVEVFGGGRSAVIHDFKQATLFSGDLDKTHKKLQAQDKGQKAMLQAWLNGLKSGQPCVSYESLMANSLATILAVESMTLNQPMAVDLSVLA